MLEKPQIVVIANYRLPTEKAHGFQIAKMCEEFSRLGVATELWHAKRANEINQDIFSYYNLAKNFSVRQINSRDFIRFSYFLGKLAFWFQALSFLFCLWGERPKAGTLIFSRQPEVIWLFKRKGYKTVFDAHFWPNSKEWFFRYLISKTDFVVCNSWGTAREYISQGFAKVLPVPNGVDLATFAMVEESPLELRRKFNLPVDKKLIMYVGHLYHWKGVDTLIEVAEKTKDDKVFVFVGGTNSDLKKYQQIVKSKELKNVLLLGQAKKETIPSYLKSADCLVLPNVPVSRESEIYTSPIKMFEYMASGVPIVASDLPSLREILNNRNCLFFKAGDHEELNKKIDLTFLEQAAAQERSKQAREDVSQYSWDKRALKIYNFIYE